MGSTTSLANVEEQILQEKNLKRQNLLQRLQKKAAIDISQLTPQELETVREDISLRSVAPAGCTVLTCHDKCKFSSKCELFLIGKHPIGKDCPYESVVYADTIASAIQEFDIDPSSYVDMGYVNELASIGLLLMRNDLLFSIEENSDLTQDDTFIGENGSVTITKKMSRFISSRDILSKRREKIINLMVGDRKEKYKKQVALKQSEGSSISNRQSTILAEFKQSQLEKAPSDGITPDELLNGK